MRLPLAPISEAINHQGIHDTVSHQAAMWLQRVVEIPPADSTRPPTPPRDVLPETIRVINTIWHMAATRRWRVVTVWNYWRVGRINLGPDLDCYRLRSPLMSRWTLPMGQLAANVDRARIEALPGDFI